MPAIRHNPETVTAALGGYSQGIEIDPGARLFFISGQIPERPGQELPTDFRGQCEAAWENIAAMLESAGMELGDLVMVTTYLTSRDFVLENREVRQRYVGHVNPALTVVITQTVNERWLLEIDAIAARQPDRD